MYQHVVVAITFETDHDPERSLQAAQALAGKGAQVTLLHVKDSVPSYAIDYVPQDYDIRLKEAIRDRLTELSDRFEHGTGVLVEGHSGTTILEWAAANGADCIVIASHRPGLRDFLLGSTAGRVVRHATCSVHVVR